MDGNQLWFSPGSRYEGSRWMSVYDNKKVRLCAQRNCEICKPDVREALRSFHGGKLEVKLTLHRTPSFFAPEEYYLGHIVSIPVDEVAALGSDEEIETDYSILNAICVRTSKGVIVIDPGSAGFGEEEKAILQLVSGQKVLGGIVSHGHLDHWNNMGLIQARFYMSPIAWQLATRHAALQRDWRLESVLRMTSPVSPGQTVVFGNGTQIRVETFPFPHSIPETMGLVIKGEKARLVHLSDFKFSGMESRQKAETIATLSRVAEKGVDILSLNIINAHIKGFTPLEALVVDSLIDIIMRAKGRTIVACFASNLERIQRIVDIAKLLGRPVRFLGSGMQNTRELLKVESGEGATEKSVILVTGCQAEEKSVLWRSAKDLNPSLILEPGDTLALSSRCIPGNEIAIREMVNAISSRVAKVIVNEGEKKQVGLDGSDYPNIEEAFLHVSGHGAEEDLRLALEILKPKKVLAWPQTSPQIEAFRAIAEPLGIEILPETQRVIDI